MDAIQIDEDPCILPKGNLLGFVGLAGAGKSTAADFLVDDFDFVKVKFSAPLKCMLFAFYDSVGLTPEEIEDRIEGDLKEAPCKFLGGQTPRHAMIHLGTLWGREAMHTDLWVNAWRTRVRGLLDAGINVVVDDLRFPNEEILVREFEGTIIRVEGKTRRASSKHVSESYMIEGDEVIHNIGDKAVLKSQLYEIFAII
jgi:hypothetical protein